MTKGLRKYAPIFLLPTFIAFLIAFIIPFVMGIYLSFTEFTTVADASFVGLRNYIEIFKSNEGFLSALWFTVRFTETVKYG